MKHRAAWSLIVFHPRPGHVLRISSLTSHQGCSYAKNIAVPQMCFFPSARRPQPRPPRPTPSGSQRPTPAKPAPTLETRAQSQRVLQQGSKTSCTTLPLRNKFRIILNNHRILLSYSDADEIARCQRQGCRAGRRVIRAHLSLAACTMFGHVLNISCDHKSPIPIQMFSDGSPGVSDRANTVSMVIAPGMRH